MQIELSFLSVFDVFSVVTAFMLGLLFLTSKSDNKKANIFLGLFLWSLAFEVFGTLTQSFSDDDFFIPQTSLFTIPLLFFYVKATINETIKSWFYAIFLFGLIVNILMLPELFGFVEYAFNIAILVFILNILKRHKKRVNNYYSDLEHKTLQWIQLIVYLFLGFHLLWIIEDFVVFQSDNYFEYFVTASTILTFFMIYWIGHNGFSQSEIFKQQLFLATKEKNENEHVFLKEDLQKFETIKQQIQLEKLFSNPKLNLRNLSETLQIKEKELSRLINQQSQTNFYQFINQFRINEFKRLLKSPKSNRLSILGLAQEAGFSSKTTFYTAFKTLEGTTPKQYALSLKKSE